MEPSVSSWILVIALYLGLPLLSRRSVRRLLGPPVIRLGRWALARARPEPDVNHEADELWNAVRRQELAAHIQRLERILVSDMSMSATRQIANRLAYGQLLRDLENTPAVSAVTPLGATTARWNSSAGPAMASGPQLAPTVEILEIGWRR